MLKNIIYVLTLKKIPKLSWSSPYEYNLKPKLITVFYLIFGLILFGIGYSFQIIDWSEFYSNLSQNYRAVTFADINTINPNFVINPNIQDEDGYTFDFGFRGKFKEYFSYDISFFHLSYNNRIGFVQKEFYDQITGLRVVNEKGNVGDATILGNENLFNFNINELLGLKPQFQINYY